MQVSARRGISYPVAGRTDAPDIPLHFANLINAIDLDTPLYTGTEAAKPAANTRVQGSWYWATDSSLLYFNTGATWLGLTASASPALTGTPTAPTQANTDNSTRIATTAFVRSIVPPGVVNPYIAAAAPSGWLLCDGSAVSRTTFSALFAVIGTTFGAGDGSTTFNLPDLRGKVPVGKSAAGTFVTLGAVGGEETHALTVGEMPTHAHTMSSDSAGTPTGSVVANSAGTPSGGVSVFADGPAGSTVLGTTTLEVTTGGASPRLNSISLGSESHTHGASFAGNAMAAHGHTWTGNAMTAHSHTVNNSGGNGSHNNIQPFIVLTYIIKT